MFNIKSLLISAATAAILTACTTTSSELKRSSNTPVNANVSTNHEVASVSDVIDSATSNHSPKEGLPEYSIDLSGSSNKMSVLMQSNFERSFQMCETESSCQKIQPIYPQSSNSISGGTTRDGSDALIAKVELSEGTKQLFGKRLSNVAAGKRILIMKPDIELYELGVALREPNAHWTSIANNYVTEISAQYFQKLGYNVALYTDNANQVPEKTGQDLINLHEDTGISIIQFQQQSISQLPTLSTGKFDWKLGKTTMELAKGYGADYGLFIYLRDSYSSGSRVAAKLLMSVLFGVHVQGGTQVGFASLVNLQTGEIEWFNRIISTTGDLRTFGAAVNATDALYEDIPL